MATKLNARCQSTSKISKNEVKFNKCPKNSMSSNERGESTVSTVETVTELSTHNTSMPFFSKLRRLASNVESGVKVIHQELNSSSSTKRLCDSSNHAAAINVLWHKKKEMKDLGLDAKKLAIEFEVRNKHVNLNRMQHLFRNTLLNMSERLDKVESFIEHYGYERPPNLDSKLNKDGSNDSKDKYECCTANGSLDANQSVSNIIDDDLSKEPTETDEESFSSCSIESETETAEVMTTTPPPASEKEETIIRTPRVEDLYQCLSEDTVMLFKYGKGKHSQAEVAGTHSGFSSSEIVPSPNTSHVTDISCLKTPEPPKLRTPGFKLHYKNTEVEQTKKSSRSLFGSLPSPPKLRTITLTQSDFVSSAVSSLDKKSTTHDKENVSISQDAAMRSWAFTEKAIAPAKPELLSKQTHMKLGAQSCSQTDQDSSESRVDTSNTNPYRKAFSSPPLPKLLGNYDFLKK